MNGNADKYLDDLAKKVINESVEESPSFNFTNAVMSKVEALNENRVIVYKPLISKTGWGFIVLVCLAVLCYALFSGNPTETLVWFDKIDFSFVSNTLSGLKLSKTAMYSIVLFGFMFCIQIPILKHHFDKRFDV
ncbi:hypothetical protein [Aestuariivivens insulae]|uniref:hypothetical protein n=1 Tax=Aestuariivivens insulae TaxID=1621988 RepID=UPI001F5AF8EA|nr:hypothetical protein [Aestuariivivens insulae]